MALERLRHSAARPLGPLLQALVLGLTLSACGQGAAGAPDGGSTPPTPLARNLVLISLDTLRADSLGCYGYRKGTSPKIDAFAQDALVFRDCTSAASSTTPSHMSMFTGLVPPVHRVFNASGDAKQGAGKVAVLPASIPTLAQRLERAGFLTAAFTDGGYLTREMQFDRGFREWQQGPETVDKKVDRVLKWLTEVDRSERVFLFVHTYEIHSPYVPPIEHDLFTDSEYAGPWREKVAALRVAEDRIGGLHLARGFLPRDPGDASPADRRFLAGLYLGGVHFTDAEIGRLLEVLSRPPWSEDTAVILLSDHGEAFKEHGKFSHGSVYRAVTHVPLIVRTPGGRQGVVETPVAGVDVLPTALEILGQAAPEVCDGVSLLGELRPDRPITSYNAQPWTRGGMSVRVDADKLLRNLKNQPWQRFDLSTDLYERDAQTAEGPRGERLLDLIEHLNERQQELSRLLHKQGVSETATLSDETLAELQALGYLGGDG